MELQLIDYSTVKPELLRSIHELHRVLRPHLSPEVAEYREKMLQIQRGGGQTLIARVHDKAVGLSVFRVYPDTVNGIRYYCDDLVTLPNERSRGVGKALIAWMKKDALKHGAIHLSLVKE